MRRLGIFSFYDNDGIVDSYIEFLLDEMLTVVDKLIVTVNGQVNEQGKGILQRYTEDLLIRENRGFDAGAYRDVIVDVLGERIGDWDEVVLCNDTFFGPFVPMKQIFSEMGQKNVDFWGLDYSNNGIYYNLFGYFLVFGQRIIRDGVLTSFFRDRIDPHERDKLDIVGKFEMGIFRYMEHQGYSYGTYCSTSGYSIFSSPDICIEKCGLPILKKRAFHEDFRGTGSAAYAVQYLAENSSYPIDYILQSIGRIYGVRCEPAQLPNRTTGSAADKSSPVARYSGADLIKIIGEREFYIYGSGEHAHYMFYNWLHRCRGLRGFVVSNGREIKKSVIGGFPVFHYSEIDKSALIVICVSKKMTPTIKKELDEGADYIELW